MNFYNISQEPSRYQLAQHYHSSLQEPNLQNVESQLYVTRQRNYQLAQQYFQQKYGNGELYNKYVQNNNLSGLGPPTQPHYDLKRQLQKKALQIQQQQTRKLNEKRGRRAKLNDQEQYEGKEYKIANKRHRQRQNIWSKQANTKQNKQQKLQKIQRQPQYQININQQKQGNFISQFKNYLSNKKKLKEEPKQMKKTTLDQSLTISQFKGTGSSFSPMKSINKGEANQSKYQEQLAKKIIKDIAGQAGPSVSVEKIEIVQYINTNKKILKVLNVSAEEATKGVMTFNTKDSNKMSYNECIMFILQTFGKTQQLKKLRAKQQFEIVPQGCMLSAQILSIFQNSFRSLDQYNDLIIKRIPFISKLTNDPIIKKNLNLPAVFEPQYNRHVSLRRIFERIEMETILCTEEQKKINEYISWSQFIRYFQSGHKKRAKYSLITLIQSLRNEQKFGLNYLSDSILDIINFGIKRADKGEQLLQTIQIINQIKMHKEYQIQKYSSIKNSQQQNDSELTFQDILINIKEKGLKYVTPKQFMEYFSLKGKPVEQFQKQRNQRQNKNLSAVKVSFVEKQLFLAKQQPNGYDSDPQMYNNSKIYDNNASQMRKSQKQFKKTKYNAQSFIQKDLNDKIDVQQHGNFTGIKVTVPKPFSFEQRQKQRKNKRKTQQIKQQHKSSFKAAPIPTKVAQIGLYDRMMEEQHKKNKERKRCSMIMTLANEKPFSFENRKTNKKTKQQRQKFAFKAEPIPWFCSVNLLQKKKEEEIVRNQRIAKMAQQKLAKAKLPPRMQKDFLQKEAAKAIQQKQIKKSSNSPIKVKQPPNFEKIHRQFEQALQRKRKQNKTTQIKQFKFTSASKPPKNTQTQFYPQFHQQKKHQIPASHKSNIDIFAQSTAKFNQQVQKRRKEMQQKRKQELMKQKQEQQRQKVNEQLKKKVQQAANKNKQNKQKQQLQKKKQQLQKQHNNFKIWKQECIEKGRKQPMLVQRISKRDEKIDKMKKLYDISQTLKKNGIQGKEHDHYFKREELLLLEDYKILKDKL